MPITIQEATRTAEARAVVNKESRKLKWRPAWDEKKIKCKTAVIQRAKKDWKTVHVANLLDLCPLNNAELENRVCATERHRQRRRVLQSCIRTARAAAELLDTISKFPGRAGEARDPVSAYSQVKMTEVPRWWKFPEAECLEIWTRIPPRQRPKDWDKMIEDPVVPLERNWHDHPWARLLWGRQIEDVLLEIAWREVPTWECLFVHKKLGLFSPIYEDDFKNDPRKTE